jgi:hypothetical protein
MGLSALRGHRNDSAGAQFHTLLNGPLHAIELEDGKDEGQPDSRSGRNDFAELKLDPPGGDVGDTTAADTLTSHNVKFLPDPAAKHLREMLGVETDQSSAIAGDFVSDPTAAGHAVFRCVITNLSSTIRSLSS